MDLYLLYLDRDHLDDLLFLQHLARQLAKAGREAPPCIVLHGSGELAERWLEGDGFFPEREGGLLRVSSAREAALVERAVRETNRKLVGLLTDTLVYAVGLQGVDRNLLRLEADGTVVAGPAAWIAALARKGAVPVISALVHDLGKPVPVREVPAARAAIALVQALPAAQAGVVFFTRDSAGEGPAQKLDPVLPYDALPEEGLSEPESVRQVVRAGVPVMVTSVAGLLHEDGPRGTRVVT